MVKRLYTLLICIKKGKVIETLLEYGADVNINNSHSLYARYTSPEFFDEFDRFYRKYDFRDNVFNNHFVKMKVAKIYLNRKITSNN